MKGKGSKILFGVLLAVFLIVFSVSAFMLIRYMANSHKQQSTFDELSHLVEKSPRDTEPTEAEEDVTRPETPRDPFADCVQVRNPKTGKNIPVLPNYVELFKRNPDVVGWMKLEDTKLNYPVLQASDRKEYYLRRDFYGEYSIHGCLFVQENSDVFRPSDNLTIYGHFMQDGTMFAALHEYKDREFWENHKIITFDTLSQHNQYEVFAVFKTSATPQKGFAYNHFVDAARPAQFDHYVHTCKDLSFYDTGITPQYGEKLITLSTCDYSLENGRLVVVARKLPEKPEQSLTEPAGQ